MRKRSDDISKELESISTAVANLPSEIPFTVPEGYFERLPDEVLSLVQATNTQQEVEGLSPLLASLRDFKPFSVPEGYFESIQPGSVIPQSGQGSNTAETSQAIIRKMPLRTLVIRLAAAASIIGGIALAAWLMTDRADSVPGMETATVIAQMPNQAAVDTLAVSEEALAGFLLEDDAMPTGEILEDADFENAGELAILDLNENRIQDLLREIPDAALETYVAQNPDSQVTTSLN